MCQWKWAADTRHQGAQAAEPSPPRWGPQRWAGTRTTARTRTQPLHPAGGPESGPLTVFQCVWANVCVCVSVLVCWGEKKTGAGTARSRRPPQTHRTPLDYPATKGAHLVHAGISVRFAGKTDLTERRAEAAAMAKASVWARDFSEHTVHGNNHCGVCAISLGAKITPQHCPSPRVTGRRAPKVTLGSFLFVLSAWSPRAVTRWKFAPIQQSSPRHGSLLLIWIIWTTCLAATHGNSSAARQGKY